MRKTIAGILVALLLCPLGAYAQERGRLEATIPAAQPRMARAPGVISRAAAREVARLSESQSATTAGSQPAGPSRSWAARHPVLTGLLIGAGAGAAYGAAANHDTGCFDSGASPCPGVYAALNAGLWGGVGALIGLAF